MSSAFVKESEDQWLHDIPPSLNALTVYLTRENNGIRVYEKSTQPDVKTGKTIHIMSNGLGYATDANNKWYIDL